MLSSFTNDEKKVVGFVLAIMAGGFGIIQFTKPKPEPLFLDSYHSVELTSGTATVATSGTLQSIMTSGGQINVNSANAEALAAIPGIGPSLAEEIISYRNTHGGFRSVEELDGVKGIGASKLLKMRPYVAVNDAVNSSPAVIAQQPMQAPGIMPGATELARQPHQSAAGPATAVPKPYASALQQPQAALQIAQPPPQATPVVYSRSAAPATALNGIININTAGQQELETLKRVGPVIAKRIIEYRQQHGAFPNVNALEDVKGIGPKILEDNRARLTVR
ncbi:MAG: helix-hairpin-helix domain-containing protein [Candidatus Sumerlaeaceae bacterium]